MPPRGIKQLESCQEVLKISLDEVNKAELEVAPLAIDSNIFIFTPVPYIGKSHGKLDFGSAYQNRD
ncbi:hypothetical protein [Nostoc sp.]